MSSKALQEKIREADFYKDCKQFVYSEARKHVDYTMRKDLGDNLSNALRDMVASGELVKSADGTRYSRRGGAGDLLRKPWRKRADLALGILPPWDRESSYGQ